MGMERFGRQRILDTAQEFRRGASAFAANTLGPLGIAAAVALVGDIVVLHDEVEVACISAASLADGLVARIDESSESSETVIAHEIWPLITGAYTQLADRSDVGILWTLDDLRTREVRYTTIADTSLSFIAKGERAVHGETAQLHTMSLLVDDAEGQIPERGMVVSLEGTIRDQNGEPFLPEGQSPEEAAARVANFLQEFLGLLPTHHTC